MADMGLGVLGGQELCVKQKFRWLFFIPQISDTGTNALPPSKGARPGITFKEMEVQHLSETVYYPSKADWKPVSLTLYDIKRTSNPVFTWLQRCYNPCTGRFLPSVGNNFKLKGTLELYNGCGDILERWVYENIYPQSIEFGELEMSNAEVVTVDLTLRYDRAYIEDQC